MESQRPLSEQVAQNAERLQAPDSQKAPEWLQYVEVSESPTAHELHMRQLLGGMAMAGLVNSPKEYVDMLTELLRQDNE